MQLQVDTRAMENRPVRFRLIEYVGWKNVQSAMRYVEAADPFGKRRIESALPAILSKR